MVSTERQAAAVATSDAGSQAPHTAARPEPAAIAVAPNSPQMTTDHSTTRTRSGAVEGVDASVPTSTAVATYPLVKTSAATGTVQSRSPSAIRSASGP